MGNIKLTALTALRETEILWRKMAELGCGKYYAIPELGEEYSHIKYYKGTCPLCEYTFEYQASDDISTDCKRCLLWDHSSRCMANEYGNWTKALGRGSMMLAARSIADKAKDAIDFLESLGYSE